MICILAAVSVILAIIDISSGLAPWMKIVDNSIYCFFVFEYAIRFLLADKKKSFFKSNLLDLVAILPLSSALRVFRVAKFVRLLKLTKFVKLTKFTKLTRLFALLARMVSKSKSFFDTNGFKYMLMISGVLILIGGTLISFFEKMTFSDGLWWAFVTTTTVGYGDISPSSLPGRMVACTLMLCGIGLIGSLTSTITSFFLNSRKEDEPVSNERVDMVKKLYDTLNDSEKEVFKEIIK